jgi:nucleoside triphosphate diphosphatase
LTKADDAVGDGDKKSVADLLEVMAALRTPSTGCPWDLEQTFRTIAPYTLEEAYEVADAIERDDLVDLREELGDLLLQVVYHAQMAREADAFDFSDVVDTITRKMVRRHPHVFGDAETRAAGARPGFWERIKAEERAEKAAAHKSAGLDTSETPQTLLGDVPVNLPALVRAVKLQGTAARVGFDWPSLVPVMDKMREELRELEEAVSSEDSDRIEDEFGDLLFVMANVARHLKIDPEASLRRTNEKFVRRFRRIEEMLHEKGKRPDASSLAEMDALWDEAKREERGADEEF